MPPKNRTGTLMDKKSVDRNKKSEENSRSQLSGSIHRMTQGSIRSKGNISISSKGSHLENFLNNANKYSQGKLFHHQSNSKSIFSANNFARLKQGTVYSKAQSDETIIENQEDMMEVEDDQLPNSYSGISNKLNKSSFLTEKSHESGPF